MKILKPLSFIKKENLTEFEILKSGSFYILTAGNGHTKFKQILKQSEYNQVLQNQVVDVKEEIKKERKPRKTQNKTTESIEKDDLGVF